MIKPLFERISKRSWTNRLGRTNPSVVLRIYKTNSGGDFEAFISSPAGYTVLKFIQDLADLRGFLDEAIREFSVDLIEGKPKRIGTTKTLRSKGGRD